MDMKGFVIVMLRKWAGIWYIIYKLIYVTQQITGGIEEE